MWNYFMCIILWILKSFEYIIVPKYIAEKNNKVDYIMVHCLLFYLAFFMFII